MLEAGSSRRYRTIQMEVIYRRAPQNACAPARRFLDMTAQDGGAHLGTRGPLSAPE
jgi:hypothetical protein